jgi:metal-dependent amidase/aminoacylase/carboxypeptidase family protein
MSMSRKFVYICILLFPLIASAASRLGDTFTQVFGKDRVEIVRPVMGSEDFSYYAQEIKVPSLFFWIGTQAQKENPPINHSPRYLPAFTPTVETSIVAMTSAVLDLNGSKVRAKAD